MASKQWYFAFFVALSYGVQSFNIDDLDLPSLSETFDTGSSGNVHATVPSSAHVQQPLETGMKTELKTGGLVKSGGSTREIFPQKNPFVCIAFLSCCNRTDLLWKTMSAAVRHMEEDEPDVSYELAWVDNGSEDAKLVDASQVEHVKLLEANMGLAWGLNSLFFDMCTAPYVLILEEDWMYMDSSIATQVLCLTLYRLTTTLYLKFQQVTCSIKQTYDRPLGVCMQLGGR